ncbi:MAG: hypothetical protein ACLP7A_07545 [Desulfobaccales bacterium]
MTKSWKDEATEEFLTIQLDMMKWYYLIHPKYIKDFTGSYWFKDKDGKVSVLVKFHDGEMEIHKDPDPDPKPYPETTVMVTFKDSNALRRFLLAVKKDILQVILHNEILVTGNLNYLYKFVFMANHPLPLRELLNLENEFT